MPFGLGKKEESDMPSEFDKDELDEIKRIQEFLESDEKVLALARQGKFTTGGALVAPNTIFATDRRVIIRNPTMMGLRASLEDIPFDKITSIKLEKGMFSSSIVLRVPGLSELGRLSKFNLAWGKGEEGTIDGLPKDKAERVVKVIKEGIERVKVRTQTPTQASVNVTDELMKLADLKSKGIISDEEFAQLKADLLSRK
jgi:hypothetical protein